MASSLPFRWRCIIAYVRITIESLDRTQEGWFILITLRLAGLATMASIMAYVVNPQRMAWASVPLPAWLRWTGAGLLATCALLLTWTLHSLGKNLTDTVVTRKTHTLVMTGPYRWVRHPYFLGILLMLVGAIVAMRSLPALILLYPALRVTLLRAHREEHNLVLRFGESYLTYHERVPFMLPLRPPLPRTAPPPGPTEPGA